MRMREALLVVLLMLGSLNFFQAKAQDSTRRDSPQPPRERSSQIRVFSDDDSYKKDSKKHASGRSSRNQKNLGKSDFYERNALSINPLLIGRGVFGFSYERLVTHYIAIEAMAALTYRDFVYEALSGNRYRQERGPYEATAGGGGYLAIQIYPSGTRSFDGIYIAPIVRYFQYNITTPGTNFQANDPSAYYADKNDASYRMIDMGVLFGQQQQPSSTSDILHNAYIGFGLRLVDDHDLAETKTIDNQGIVTSYISSKLTYKSLPILFFGYSIGLSL